MTNFPFGPLVSTDWLAERLSDPDLRVVDARHFMPNDPRDPAEEYARAHIPGAVFLDIDAVADPDTALPHMLPSAEGFAAGVGALGIGTGDRVVVYDHVGGACAAARVWCMFRAFGHDAVAVLDGGLPKWQAEGRAISDTPTVPSRRAFTATPVTGAFVDAATVLARLTDGAARVVDVRGAGRFRGEDEEPRPAARRGHMPGAVNAPFGDLQTGPYKQMADPDAIRAHFAAAGVDLSRPVVTSCGSGVTACYSALALSLIGHDRVAVYDGSWAEWGDREDLPVAG
jgi:thiosulfate/3-mercaptopyruvate sulfurtransferase